MSQKRLNSGAYTNSPFAGDRLYDFGAIDFSKRRVGIPGCGGNTKTKPGYKLNYELRVMKPLTLGT
jgi:hypothetical protein